MRNWLKVSLGIAACAAAMPVVAQTYVDGYFRSDGTYVAPHVRSAPNTNPYDNYSTQGNVNPYTGQKGTVSPYPSYPSVPAWRPSQPSTVNPYQRQYSPPAPIYPRYNTLPQGCLSSYSC